jgi:hypothetical protein
MGPFLSSGEGWETPTLLGPLRLTLSNGPTRVDVSFRSPEDGKWESDPFSENVMLLVI